MPDIATTAAVGASAPPRDAALFGVLGWLKDRSYRFVSPTPATHERVIAREPARLARDLRDVFGWSLPFAAELLPRDLLALLTAAEALAPEQAGLMRSRYRVSSVVGELFLHSAYPTDAADAVFLGPDSYRFAHFIGAELERAPPPPGASLADIGTGSGVGAIAAGKRAALGQLWLTDVNRKALDLACVNVRAAGAEADCVLGSGLDPVPGLIDLVIANPPYMIDSERRSYRDGGDLHGARLTLDIAGAALPRLAPGGRLLLYSGSAIVGGEDRLEQALRALAAKPGFRIRYREIDPDVFGEELQTEPYREVDRIAVIGAVVERDNG